MTAAELKLDFELTIDISYLALAGDQRVSVVKILEIWRRLIAL